jgi:hypothetical protein
MLVVGVLDEVVGVLEGFGAKKKSDDLLVVSKANRRTAAANNKCVR